MNAMRILLVGDYPADPRLGSSKVYYKLREEFLRLGQQCDVMLGPALGAWPRASKLRWALTPWVASHAVAQVADRYDVIDIASAEGGALGVRRALAPSARYAIVSRSHGLEHRNYQRSLDDAAAGLVRKSWYRRWWYPVARLSQVALAARLADRLIVLNADDAAFAIDRGWKRADCVDVIAHGVSDRFLVDTPAPGSPRGRGILYCGTWGDMKGVRYLADAFATVVAQRPRARLTILGPGVPEEHVLSSFAPAARPAVTVIPRVSEDEVMEQYRTHDMLVLSSTYEGFGMVVLEAMSQRLPVIATPMGSALSLVRDGETGLRVPLRASGPLADAMIRLLDDQTFARRLADAAYPMAMAQTWRHTALRTLETYAQAISAYRAAT